MWVENSVSDWMVGNWASENLIDWVVNLVGDWVCYKGGWMSDSVSG